MSINKLNTEGIMLFEQPFTKVPYENYRKVFRASQRNVEREFGAIQAAVNDLAKRAKTGNSNPEDSIKSIESMIARTENLKRKLADLQSSAGTPTLRVMKERFQHLAAVEEMQSTGDPEFGRWADTRLDRWLVDWALRNGKEKTARMIAEDRGIEMLVDIDLFADVRRIEEALKRQSCTEALTWCSENKVALRKLKNTLEFDLRFQEYIELVRNAKHEEARAYLQKHLLAWQETHMCQIFLASALLCFPPTTTCTKYKRLYDPARWATLTHSFRLAAYNLSTLPTEPLLHLALYAGLVPLKLAPCFDPHEKNIDCPICDPSLGKLAEEVPFGHHFNSVIVCRLSGKIMDEDNPPMAFPHNGHVYSKLALEEMALKHNGRVTCPKTGENCDFTELRKVFIS